MDPEDWRSAIGQQDASRRSTPRESSLPFAGQELALAANVVHKKPKSDHNAATFRASEPGEIDLSRLLATTDTSTSTERSLATVHSVRVLNALDLVNGGPAPAGVFSPLRQQGINLGVYRLASNDTVSLVFTSSQRVNALAAPFRPSSPIRSTLRPAHFEEPHALLGACTSGDFSSGSLWLRFQVDSPGVVDLGSLVLSAVRHRTTTEEGHTAGLSATDVTNRLIVTGINLPDGRNLIVGNQHRPSGSPDEQSLSGPAIPAEIFRADRRCIPWFHFGFLVVSRGQQISVEIHWEPPKSTGASRPGDFPAQALSVSAGLRFYSADASWLKGSDWTPSPTLDQRLATHSKRPFGFR